MSDLIKKIQEVGATPTQAVGGQTERAQRLISVGQTGRAATGRGPQRAAEGERIEDSIARAQQRQVADQSVTQLRALQQQAEAMRQDAGSQVKREQEAMLQLTEGFKQRALDFQEQLRQEEGRLDAAQRQSLLEQSAFAMRLSNEKYLHELQTTGRRERLNDAIEFKKALTEDIWREQKSLLEDRLAFEEMMALNEADFQRLLASIDLESAMTMMNDSISAANQQQMWTGIGGIISGVAQAYSE